MMILTLLAGLMMGCSEGKQGTIAGEKNELSGTIRISNFAPNPFLEEAAKKFANHNPNVKVEIDTYLSPEILEEKNRAEHYDDYVNLLNTELMSGKGADIIGDATRLPYYKKYISHHIFADLNQLMEADQGFDTSQYHRNIFEAMEVNGDLYVLPVDYSYELLGSKSKMNVDDKTWNWEEFFEVAQKELETTREEKYMLPFSYEFVFTKIFKQNYGHFVNEEEKTANFTTEEFINLLKQCKGLGDRDLLVKSTAETADVGKESLFQYCEGFSIDSLALSLTDGETNLYRWPSDNQGGYEFSAGGMYALNDVSLNETGAWEFLKFLLSDEIQTSLFLTFPIKQSALQEKIVFSTKLINQNESIHLSESEKAELIEKSVSYHESMVNDLKVYLYVNTQILDMVQTEVQPFFAEKASAEEVAQVIQEKVRIYLNE